MTQWPQAQPDWSDTALLEATRVVQNIVALGRSARESSQIRVRQPLSRLLVRPASDKVRQAVVEHETQILEELNVKTLSFIAADADLVTYRIKPNLPRLGKRYGKLIPKNP
jgi:isoleucyl-tRNA synthetase